MDKWSPRMEKTILQWINWHLAWINPIYNGYVKIHPDPRRLSPHPSEKTVKSNLNSLKLNKLIGKRGAHNEL